MKNFILTDDFNSIATTEDLALLSDDNNAIITACNQIAIDEAAGYLANKYDIPTLFADPKLYSTGDTYVINDRIYTSATSGNTHYTCTASGATSGTAITDTTYFTQEDSRDNKLLEVVMSMSLFYIHKRITPNNVPFFRVVAYDGNGDEKIMSAIKWLQLVQSGEITPYNWPEVTDNSQDPEVDVPYDKLGNNPGLGIMWGTDLGEDYFYYNILQDPNIINTGTTS